MSKSQLILLEARKEIFSNSSGSHLSIFRGDGYDFSQLQEYSVGDDIRHINWSVTARLQKVYINVFNQERSLEVVIVPLLGGNLHFGSPQTKHEIVAKICAILGFSAINNNDHFSAYLFSDELLWHQASTKKSNYVELLAEKILQYNAIGKKVDLQTVASTLHARLRQKSLIVFIGDFFEIPDFRSLAKRHDIVCCVVRDIAEEEPKNIGNATLLDLQSQVVLDGYFSSKKLEQYASAVRKHDDELFKKLKQEKIRLSKIYGEKKILPQLKRAFR